MRFVAPLALAGLVAVAACDVQDVVQPEVEGPVAAAVPGTGKACRPSQLSSSTTGTIDSSDCTFDAGGATRYEDLYLVNQKRLGLPDLSGANMLTFTATADFDAIFGLGGLAGGGFPDPVYGYARFGAGATGTWGNAFSVIGSGATYKAWFGGQAADDQGAYTLTTSVSPSIDSCENGHWVFIQGDVRFSSDISDATSCRGTVQFGPNAGAPLNYQFWYHRLLPGETLSATLTAIDADPSLVLAAIDLGAGEAVLDFEQAAGDTDRAVSFTASRMVYLYLEVSTAPGVNAGYTLTVDGP